MLSWYSLLYIFWLLHQTTTWSGAWGGTRKVVYLLIPTSNHNKYNFWQKTSYVVYLLIPTSNHNLTIHFTFSLVLYIFWFLHQATTHIATAVNREGCISFDSYIKPQQIQALMDKDIYCISFDSYIKPQLLLRAITFMAGCISFDSYIKPQPSAESLRQDLVVYLLIPTSNHNR